MIQPRYQTQNLLLSIIENCETLIKQTHTKPYGTLEIKLTTPRESFSFKRADPLINLLARYERSIFQDVESFLRKSVDLVEDEIRLVLDENKSRFITY